MAVSFDDSSDTPSLNSDKPPLNDDVEVLGAESDSGSSNDESDSDSDGVAELEVDTENVEANEGGANEGGANEGDAADAVTPDPEPTKATGRKTASRAFVWEHMESIMLPGGVKKNKCKHCSRILSNQSGGTTTHLMRHLKLACPARHKLFPKDVSSSGTCKSLQSQLHGVVLSEGESSVQPFTFNWDRVKELAAHMVLAHEYPFMIVEHKIFNEFLRAYTPYYKKLGRHVVRKECFLVFEREREKIKTLLGTIDRVGLTTDCWWSGVQKIGYMVITCHFIDRDWQLQKRVLSFVNVPPPHNGVALAKEVHRVSNSFGISEKVASVTVDNASANDVCIDILRTDYKAKSNLVLDGKLFHVRCCAHIINLLVRDGLKEIEEVTSFVREGVKYLFGSENRLVSFNEHRLNLQLPANKLVLDNNTRWNSTYVMLNTAYTYRQCFKKFAEEDDSFSRFCPSDLQWEQVHEVCEFLEIFLDVTNLISGSNYPTVNLFLLELSRIKELINAQLDNEDTKHMQSMAVRMAVKFDKYWKECDLLLCFGSILDPRYKMGMLSFAFESMYPVDFESRIASIKTSFQSVYDQYAKAYSDSNENEHESFTSTVRQPPPSKVGNQKFDDYMIRKKFRGKEKSDLECYLDEACYTNVPTLDVLSWWRVNQGKYKILSKMAKDILSIPITTVSSESTFSAGGRVIDKKRASMRRDTIEVLLCAGDWIKDMYGIRSPKLENEDPVELEFEKEFEMVDPNNIPAAAPVVSNQPIVSAAEPQVDKSSNATRKSSSSCKPPPSKKSKRTRRT